MKFRMILTALLLPAVVLAQQPGEKPKSAPPADTNALRGYSYIVPANGQNPYIGSLFTTAAPEQSNVRVNLNLRNAPLKEAIKQLGKQTKQEFVLEDDAPADARVTVVAKNIRLNTALDMLTDATGLNWNQQAVKKPDSKETTVVFHLGKKVSRDFWQRSSVSPFINNVGPWNGQNSTVKPNFQFTPGTNNSTLRLDFTPALKGNLNLDSKPNLLSTYTGTVQNRATLLQSKPNNLSTLLQSEPYNLATNLTVGDTLLSSIGFNEVRSTFTCPHCKNQVTVIHKHESPKCEKCGRVFHDDWQFCPFDGAKRPAGADADWQFCPICGERIKPDGKADTKPEGKPNSNNARGGN